MMSFRVVLNFLFLTLIIISCGDKKVTEGKIIYTIDYPDIDKKQQSITYMLLPKKQSVTFDKDNIKIKVKKAMFDLSIVTGTNRDYFFSELIFDGSKFIDLKGEDAEKLLDYIPKYELEFTNEEDTLLGFKIKKVLASHPDIGTTEAWYTDDIQLNNANWYSPYRDLEGMLMKYEVKQFGVKMTFTASSFESIDGDSSLFKTQKGGDKIDLEQFQNEMNELFKGVIK